MNMEIRTKENMDSYILPDDKDFVISRVDSKYDNDELNVTYRWPRQFDNSTVMLVSTTTIKARALNKFRVEEIDGQFFVINDVKHNFEEQIKFCVQSKKVGMEIIRAIVEEFKVKEPLRTDLGVHSELYRYNRIAKELGALISAGCGIALTFSACIWLLLK